MQDNDRASRRGPYPRAFKTGIIEQCRQPGASVEDVAEQHGLRAALVYRWLAQDVQTVADGGHAQSSALPVFVPFEPLGSTSASAIRIELRHGEASVTIHWPMQAAASCGAWLQTWLS